MLAEQRGKIRGRAGDDGRQLEADAGQRDDADDDADGGGRGADADRVFGADHEGVEDVEEPRLASLVLQHEPRRYARSMPPTIGPRPIHSVRIPSRMQSAIAAAKATATTGLRLVRPSTMQAVMPQNAARYGVKSENSTISSTASGIGGRPVAADDVARDRQLGARQAAQAVLLGLEVDLAEHAEEMHERRHDRRKDDRLIGDGEILDHQERGRAHDRRRDLAAGRGRRLDGAGKVARIADADHRRNRERADRHGVGDRRARNHAEQARAEDRDLGGAAGEAAGQRGRKIDEEAAEPDARRQNAEQHVVEDVGRHDAKRDAENALAGEIEVVDDAFPGVARMRENAREATGRRARRPSARRR